MSENVQMELIKYINEGFNGLRSDFNSSLKSIHEKLNETKIEVAELKPQLETLAKKVDETNHFKERLIAIETQHQSNMCKYNLEEKDSNNVKTPIWQEKWFSIAIITGCVILALIVGSAIGVNIFEKWQEAQSLLG